MKFLDYSNMFDETSFQKMYGVPMSKEGIDRKNKANIRRILQKRQPINNQLI